MSDIKLIDYYNHLLHFYQNNMKIVYIKQNNSHQRGTIINIHHEDHEPYYTIQLEQDNREIQTIIDHIYLVHDPYLNIELKRIKHFIKSY